MSPDRSASSERPASAPSDPDAGKERLRRWQAATEWPLTGVGVVFLAAYAVPIIVPDLAPEARALCLGVLRVTWVVFVADYAVRVSLAPGRWRYVREHPLELAVVALPALRPLLLISVVARLNRVGALRMRGQVVRYAVAGTALLVLLGGLTVTQAERGVPGASIVDAGDGFWWTMVTITTIGYGDMVPVSVHGRLIAVCLMLGGIALLGVVTATLSSWLVERVTRARDDDLGAADGTGEPAGRAEELAAADVPLGTVASPQQVALLTAEVQALRAELGDARRRAERQREDPDGRA